MSKCEYQNDKGHCTLNECMYGDFLDRDDSNYGTGYPLCFGPEEKEENKMLLKIVLDEGAQMPCKAHKEDAGYDIYSPETVIVPARESVSIDTGVHIQIPEGYVGMLKSKSGLNVKYGITSEGVIDCGYTGSIVVKLYNHSTQNYVISAGDKITQLVIMPIADCDLVLSDSLEDTERGTGGFGSTGR